MHACFELSGLFKHTQSLAKGFMVDATPVDKHSEILGYYNAMTALGFAIGPTIGGHIGDTPQGRNTLYMAVGFLFMINAGGWKRFFHNIQ